MESSKNAQENNKKKENINNQTPENEGEDKKYFLPTDLLDDDISYDNSECQSDEEESNIDINNNEQLNINLSNNYLLKPKKNARRRSSSLGLSQNQIFSMVNNINSKYIMKNEENNLNNNNNNPDQPINNLYNNNSNQYNNININTFQSFNSIPILNNNIPINNNRNLFMNNFNLNLGIPMNNNLNNIIPIPNIQVMKKKPNIKHINSNNINNSNNNNLLNNNNINNLNNINNNINKKNVQFQTNPIKSRNIKSEFNYLPMKQMNYSTGNALKSNENLNVSEPEIKRKSSYKSVGVKSMDNTFFDLNQTFEEFLDIIYPNKISFYLKKGNGSRFLQNMLKAGKINDEEINNMFYEIANEFLDLMCDNYANYFLKQFILKLKLEHRLFLFKQISSNFEYLSKHIHATHCIQSLIGMINTEKEGVILKDILLTTDLLNLFCNNNSNHVIQKIISTLQENQRDYLNNFIFTHWLNLCEDMNGICIIKKFISENVEHSSYDKNNNPITNKIIFLLEKNSIEITIDQYGNYAMQHALDNYGYSKCINIISIVLNNIIYFSKQKSSSNVVDKVVLLIFKNNNELFNQLYQVILLNDKNLMDLCRNKYGMFVVSNLIKLINKDQKFIVRSFIIETSNRLIDNEDKILIGKIFKLLSL